MGAVAGDPGILRPAFRVCGVYQISRFADGEMRRFGIDSLSDEGIRYGIGLVLEEREERVMLR